MAKAMNWQKARTKEIQKSVRRGYAEKQITRLKLSSPAETFGTCNVCQGQYDVGDLVASVIVDGKTHSCHKECVYGKARELCLGSDEGLGCTARAAPNASYCDKHLTERYHQMEERRVKHGLEAPERPQEPLREVSAPEPPQRTQRQPKRVPRQCVVMNGGIQCENKEYANFMFCHQHMKLRREILDARGRR